MADAIAIVGMACIYPDATSPAELWENVLARRRAFRRMPDERLRAEDYHSDDRDAPDRTYVTQAAVIEGYAFDRVAFRVAGATYRAADLAHWLTLDVAGRALADAGFAEGEGLPRATTGVHLGNTLTGEFSRANVMRLRWPYVRRVMEAGLIAEGWDAERRSAFLAGLETTYKAPFPPVGNETLAGGLSNTIAGRICNHFDLNGGGYTVDGACSSSLLAVATSCGHIARGELDCALAGGVDLSLDPFELVGFAKTGALAPEDMRVYDTRSAGFWPGEGCGMIVLMRHADAIAQGRRVYAVIEGWGVSSDGSGGITRPDTEGQRLALDRAYARAGYGFDTIGYVEGHGTGTNVGDATELEVLSRARRDANPLASPLPIGSIKANIGHTKAAAGIAGLLKATMAVHEGVLPPTTGCARPQESLRGADRALRTLDAPRPWEDDPRRAAVSAMGFGGINTHVVLAAPDAPAGSGPRFGPRVERLARAYQDAELLLFAGRDVAGVIEDVERVLAYAERVSCAEVADLAAELARNVRPGPVRAAVVTSAPRELAGRLAALRDALRDGTTRLVDAEAGVFIGVGEAAPRIGYLFPGQGSPVHRDGGALARRFGETVPLYERLELPDDVDDVSTLVAQPTIVTGSMAALRVLRRLGVEAEIAVGHSLGELTSLFWAGVYDEAALLRIATARSRAMADLGSPTGAMASLAASPEEARSLTDPKEPIVLAGLNAPRQTVVSGHTEAIERLIDRAREREIRAARLSVSHAFHSALVAGAVPALRVHLEGEMTHALARTVASTVTGAILPFDVDVSGLLADQVVSPVRFSEAITCVAAQTDLLIEVGSGSVLSGLAAAHDVGPVVATDAGGDSLRGLLSAVGAAFALGAPLDHRALFEDRFTRPFALRWEPSFFASPCEEAPVSPEATPSMPPLAPASPPTAVPDPEAASPASPGPAETTAAPTPSSASPHDVLRRLVAAHAELPADSVRDDDRFLSDLHLNSLTVAQLIVDAARELGMAPPAAPTEYADATISEAVAALQSVADSSAATVTDDGGAPAGVHRWVRAFTIEEVPCRLTAPAVAPAGATAPAGRDGTWAVFAPTDAAPPPGLEPALAESCPGGGAVVWLPAEPHAAHVELLLAGARHALAERGVHRFILVQPGAASAGFAKTLHLESPRTPTCVVDVDPADPRAAEWIAAEAAAVTSFTETRYDARGQRVQPFLRPLAPAPATAAPLTKRDVLLVTGGGKGIAAECGLGLAQRTGVRLVLMGRSDPATDADLAANLARFDGVDHRYVAADVGDAASVARVLGGVQSEIGPITAVLHGAGRNEPKLIGALTTDDVAQTLAPKVTGTRNVLAAIDPDRLRFLIVFGSIIARTGLPGEADYALANGWMADLVGRWQSSRPHCRCLTVEWSIWSGVGMGERLGRADMLHERGITAITPEEGLDQLMTLLDADVSGRVVVTGRFGTGKTLRLAPESLPLMRFLEEPRVVLPAVELVADARLSIGADPYVDDHVFHGQRLLPAVVGLEAMAQAAMALVGTDRLPTFEDVTFRRPITVPGDADTTIRVAALARPDGAVDVVVRSSETGFQADHFTAVCRFDAGRSALETPPPDEIDERLDLDPGDDLYGGGLLFQRGRFRRLHGYRRLRATECVAELEVEPGRNGAAHWFGSYLPSRLVLGDPGLRDAVIHAIQPCIPHATLLPFAVERIVPGIVPTVPDGRILVHAHEREHDGNTFVYDVLVTDRFGAPIERWEGLHLRAVEDIEPPADWAIPLIAPLIERRLHDLLPAAHVRVAIDTRDDGGGSERALKDASGTSGVIARRPDGKPVARDGGVSATHAGAITIAVAGDGPVGCDAEPVATRSASAWRDLLGGDRYALAELVAAETGDDADTAATRVWTAVECLKKAGAGPTARLILERQASDGWIVFASGDLAIASGSLNVRGHGAAMAVAVLGRGDSVYGRPS